MRPGETEVRVPETVDASPLALLKHLTVTSSLSGALLNGADQPEAWFAPSKPGWFVGNVLGVIVFGIMLVGMPVMLPIQVLVWLKRLLERWLKLGGWHLRECARLSDDTMLQCMGVLAASRMSTESGALTMLMSDGEGASDERVRGWLWRGEHRGLSFGLEVRDVHSPGGRVKTQVRLELSHRDGSPVRMPVQWPPLLERAPSWDGEVLSLELSDSLMARSAAIDRRSAASSGQLDAASPRDTSTQVAEVVSAVLLANDLYVGEAAAGVEESAVVLERAASALPSSVEGGFEGVAARSALKEPRRVLRPVAWQARDWRLAQWAVPFLQVMVLPTIAALAVSLVNLLMGLIILAGINAGMRGGIHDELGTLLWLSGIPLAAVLTLLWLSSWVLPRMRFHRVRVEFPRRELTLERGVLSLGEAARVDLRRPWSTQLSRSPVESAQGGGRWLNVALNQPRPSGEDARPLRFKVQACDSEAWRSLPELEVSAPEVSADDFAQWVWPALEEASSMHGVEQSLRARLGPLVQGAAPSRPDSGEGGVAEVELVESVEVGVGRAR